jgi:hypothetical protein
MEERAEVLARVSKGAWQGWRELLTSHQAGHSWKVHPAVALSQASRQGGWQDLPGRRLCRGLESMGSLVLSVSPVDE